MSFLWMLLPFLYVVAVYAVLIVLQRINQGAKQKGEILYPDYKKQPVFMSEELDFSPGSKTSIAFFRFPAGYPYFVTAIELHVVPQCRLDVVPHFTFSLESASFNRMWVPSKTPLPVNTRHEFPAELELFQMDTLYVEVKEAKESTGPYHASISLYGYRMAKK